MSRTFVELWREAAELTEEERASLAGLLIESLEGPPDLDVDAAWRAEIERRVTELDAGTATTIPWEKVRQRLVGRLNATSPHRTSIRTSAVAGPAPRSLMPRTRTK